MDHNNTNTVRWARALRTVVSLINRSLLDIGVLLVLSSSYSRLILVLAAVSSA
jgi:glycyl-tRNA synthetase beta subunit